MAQDPAEALAFDAAEARAHRGDERRVRQRGIGLERCSDEHAEPALLRALLHLPDEGALPATGLAAEHDGLALAGERRVERRGGLFELTLAADDDRAQDLTHGRSVRRGGRCERQRRRGALIGDGDAPGLDRLAHTLQRERAAFDHRMALARPDQSAQGVREDDLSGVGLGRKAARDVHRAPDELLVEGDRLAGVEADADPKPVFGVALLLARDLLEDRHSAFERGGGRLEHDVEGVAFGLDLRAVKARDLAPDEVPVVAQELGRLRVPVRLDEGRVVTQVREQEHAGLRGGRSLGRTGCGHAGILGSVHRPHGDNGGAGTGAPRRLGVQAVLLRPWIQRQLSPERIRSAIGTASVHCIAPTKPFA